MFVCLYLHKNNLPKVQYCNRICFLNYAHQKYMKCLFTNIQKQQNMLKISLIFQKNTFFTGKEPENFQIKNAKYSGYCFYMNPNI